MTVAKVEPPETTSTVNPAWEPVGIGDSVSVLTAGGAAGTAVWIVVDGPTTTRPNSLVDGPTKLARPVEAANESIGRLVLAVEMATVVVSTEFGALMTITCEVRAAPAGTVELPNGARVIVVPDGVAVDEGPDAGVRVRTTGLAVELTLTDGTGVVTAKVGEVAGTA